MPLTAEKLNQGHLFSDAYTYINKAAYFQQLATLQAEHKQPELARKSRINAIISLKKGLDWFKKYFPTAYENFIYKTNTKIHPAKLESIIEVLDKVPLEQLETKLKNNDDLISKELDAEKACADFIAHMRTIKALPPGAYAVNAPNQAYNQTNLFGDRENFPTPREGRLHKDFSAHVVATNATGGKLITSTAPSRDLASGRITHTPNFYASREEELNYYIKEATQKIFEILADPVAEIIFRKTLRDSSQNPILEKTKKTGFFSNLIAKITQKIIENDDPSKKAAADIAAALTKSVGLNDSAQKEIATTLIPYITAMLEFKKSLTSNLDQPALTNAIQTVTTSFKEAGFTLAFSTLHPKLTKAVTQRQDILDTLASHKKEKDKYLKPFAQILLTHKVVGVISLGDDRSFMPDLGQSDYLPYEQIQGTDFSVHVTEKAEAKEQGYITSTLAVTAPVNGTSQTQQNISHLQCKLEDNHSLVLTWQLLPAFAGYVKSYQEGGTILSHCGSGLGRGALSSGAIAFASDAKMQALHNKQFETYLSSGKEKSLTTTEEEELKALHDNIVENFRTNRYSWQKREQLCASYMNAKLIHFAQHLDAQPHLTDSVKQGYFNSYRKYLILQVKELFVEERFVTAIEKNPPEIEQYPAIKRAVEAQFHEEFGLPAPLAPTVTTEQQPKAQESSANSPQIFTQPSEESRLKDYLQSLKNRIWDNRPYWEVGGWRRGEVIGEDDGGQVRAPKTIATIYNKIPEPESEKDQNWKALSQDILKIAKDAAANPSIFRKASTQKWLVQIVDELEPKTLEAQAHCTNIQLNIFASAKKSEGHKHQVSAGYKPSFFSSRQASLSVDRKGFNSNTAINISKEEQQILDLIQKAKDSKIPWVTAQEKIDTLLTKYSNLEYLDVTHQSPNPGGGRRP